MQLVKFYGSSAFLFVLIASIVCDSDNITTPSSVSTTGASEKSNGTSPANMIKAAQGSEALVQNDEPKDPGNSPSPTRLPLSDAATVPPKPSIYHNSEPTMSSDGTITNATTNKTNAANIVANSTGANAANTDKKDSKKNGVSKGGPEFLVTSLIVVLSALYV